MGLALAGTALGLLGMTLVRSFWVFAGAYFAVGLFLAALAPNAAAGIARDVPVGIRGQAYGVFQAASTTGAFIAPLAAGLIGGLFGLRGVFGALAVATGCGAVWLLGKTGSAPLGRVILEGSVDPLAVEALSEASAGRD